MVTCALVGATPSIAIELSESLRAVRPIVVASRFEKVTDPSAPVTKTCPTPGYIVAFAVTWTPAAGVPSALMIWTGKLNVPARSWNDPKNGLPFLSNAKTEMSVTSCVRPGSVMLSVVLPLILVSSQLLRTVKLLGSRLKQVKFMTNGIFTGLNSYSETPVSDIDGLQVALLEAVGDMLELVELEVLELTDIVDVDVDVMLKLIALADPVEDNREGDPEVALLNVEVAKLGEPGLADFETGGALEESLAALV
jgi:hypothetical protein